MGLTICIIKLECPSCGNLITKQCPLVFRAGKIEIPFEHSCDCGRRGNYNILELKSAKTLTEEEAKKEIGNYTQNLINTIKN